MTEFGAASRTARSSSRARPTSSSWSAPEPVLQPRDGAWWDASRIGIGPPLLRTEHGWLLIYHGVKDTVSGSVYRVGLALTGSRRADPRSAPAPELDLRTADRVRA